MNLKSISELLFWITCTFVTPLLLGCIIYTTITYDLLLQHASLSLLICGILLLSFCLVTLTVITSLRKRGSARDIPDYMLAESDLESDDERPPIVRPRPWTLKKIVGFLCRNVVSFCKFHAEYAIILVFGILCLTTSLALWIWKQTVESQYLQEDLFYSATYLLIPGVVLPVSVACLANVQGAYAKDATPYSYVPFDFVVHVPMKVIARKMVAAFVADRFKYVSNSIIGLLILMCCVYHLMSNLAMSKKDRQEERIRGLVLGALVSGIFTGIFLLVRVSKWSYETARQRLLTILEQNWRRNMNACQFLLVNERVTTLNMLRTSLKNKSRQTLTNEERQAFAYIALPLWKPKRAFIERR